MKGAWLLLLGAAGQPPKLVRTPKRPAVVDASTHDTVRNATADARRRLATRGGGRTDVYRPAPGNIYTFAPTASQTEDACTMPLEAYEKEWLPP